MNCPLAVTHSACYFAVRVLADPDVPPCAGAYRPVEVTVPEGSLLNARPPAAVVAGNVETSSRVADLVLEAFGRALGQGTMNNLTLGSDAFTYYETIGGGQGACPDADGPSAVHVAMSNTLNTPIEALELEFPLRAIEYAASPLHYVVGRDTSTSSEALFVSDIRNATFSRDLSKYRGFVPANNILAEGLASPRWGGTIKVHRDSDGGYQGIYIGADVRLFLAPLKFLRGAWRFGVRGARLDPGRADEFFVELFHLENQARRLVADRVPHRLEELHPFALVLDLRIDLSIAHQADTAAQAVHHQQVVFPGRIDDLQEEHPLHPPHFGAIAVVDGREEPLLERIAVELADFFAGELVLE